MIAPQFVDLALISFKLLVGRLKVTEDFFLNVSEKVLAILSDSVSDIFRQRFGQAFQRRRNSYFDCDCC